mgnify:CR=1 FL=1
MTANTQSKAIVRVVDDDPDVRRSWQFVIEGEGWNVLTYASALEFLEKDSPFTPGCLVLDVRMPGMSGLELQEEMTRRGIDLPILFLSGHGDISMAVSTLKRGAEDFCEKPVEPAKLRESVRRMISKNIAHRREAIDVERKRERFAMLTEREQLVVRLVARDMLNKQIAAELDIQEHTVKIHRSNACRKLEVRSALELHHYLSAIGELAEDQKAPEDRDFTDD